ncbi:hypothetical protein [Bacillus sp. T3]|nr:hypothetical protein [Bacillus sp. T3]
MKKKESKKEQLQDQAYGDEWGPVENVSYNEKTGQPVPQPKDYDEIEY